VSDLRWSLSRASLPRPSRCGNSNRRGYRLTTSLGLRSDLSAAAQGVDPFSSASRHRVSLLPGYVWMTDLQPPAVRFLQPHQCSTIRAPRVGRLLFGRRRCHGAPRSGSRSSRGTWAFNDPVPGAVTQLLSGPHVAAPVLPDAPRVRLAPPVGPARRTGESTAPRSIRTRSQCSRREPSLASRLRILESWSSSHPTHRVTLACRPL